MRANKTRRKRSTPGLAGIAIGRPDSQAALYPRQTGVAVRHSGRNPRRAIIQTDSGVGTEQERKKPRQCWEEREAAEPWPPDGMASSPAVSSDCMPSENFLGP